MKNIVVIGDFEFSDALIEKIKSLGKVSFIVNASSATDWLQKVQGADVICSDGDYLLENLSKLKNVFITYPFIELGAFDTEQLKKNGVFIANAKGSSRDSIVEWVLFATLALFRKFTKYANSTKELSFERSESLNGKKALIIGKGDIGKRIGEIYEELGIDVDYFQRGDSLFQKTKGVQLIVNCLSTNASSEKLLDKSFFIGMDKGSYFISFVRHYTFDVDGLIESINANVVAGAAIDCDPETAFDTDGAFYRKLLEQENVLVTPHVAFATKQAVENANGMMIKNIESYIVGLPQNILVKKINY